MDSLVTIYRDTLKSSIKDMFDLGECLTPLLERCHSIKVKTAFTDCDEVDPAHDSYVCEMQVTFTLTQETGESDAYDVWKLLLLPSAEDLEQSAASEMYDTAIMIAGRAVRKCVSNCLSQITGEEDTGVGDN